MKFGFYVSKNATRYIKALQSGILNKNNTAFCIVDYLHAPHLQEACEKYEIPLYRYSYRERAGKERNGYISDIFLELLKKHNCDYAFLLGGRLLLQGNILKEFDKKIINFHPSLLPSYKGTLYAIDEALKDNVILLGNTAHFINEKADDGTMIMQSVIAAKNFHGYDSVLDLQLPMLKQIISWIHQRRFIFDASGFFYVKDARYEIDTFIPNLEQ